MVQSLNSLTGHVSKSEFARMMGVSPSAVGKWIARDRIVTRGNLVDAAASRDRLLQHSRSRSKGLTGARNLVQRSPVISKKSLTFEPPVKDCRLRNDDHYSAGTCSGINGMACSVPALVAEAAIEAGIPAELAQALNAALRPALLRRMELLMDLWGIHPFITADDDETDTILARDTWVGRQWPEDALDDGYLTEDLAEAHLP